MFLKPIIDKVLQDFFGTLYEEYLENPLKGFNERKNLMESENFYKAEVPQKQGT